MNGRRGEGRGRKTEESDRTTGPQKGRQQMGMGARRMIVVVKNFWHKPRPSDLEL